MIDEARHRELLSEIEVGSSKGISDAFEYPLRKLIGNHQQTDWKEFPRPLSFDKRLRLAFVSALYPPRPCGGVAVFINNLAKRLADFGHEVTVITQSEAGRGHTVDFEDGVWVHRLPDDDTICPEFPASMPDMPELPKNNAGRVLAELNRVNDRRKFQYVVGTIWDLDMAAVIASKQYPTAMYLVTSYKLMEDSKPEWRENKSFYEDHVSKMIQAETWALKNTNHVLASTKAILQDTESAYGVKIDLDRLDILPFGVPESNEVSATKNVGDRYLELLFVGRFEHRKGADLILEILPDIMEQNKSILFTGIGDNTLQADDGRPYTAIFLEKYGSAEWISRVKFLGHVDDMTLEKAYANCDIFIAPSRYESFGLIYLEAMRFGKPCIGTTAGGIPEVVGNEETGLLVSPGDSSSLKSAIERLLSDESLRVKFGEAGRQRYLDKFTTGRFASSFQALVSQWVA